MPDTETQPPEDLQQAYPLKKQFYTRVIPLLVLFVGVFAVALWFSFTHISRDIYLEQALHRAEIIADTVKDAEPEAWQALLDGKMLAQHHAALEAVFGEEVERQHLNGLKVYDLRGEVIYDIDKSKIGKIETAPAFRQTVINAQPVLLRKKENGEVQLRDLYPIFRCDRQPAHRVRAV